MNASRNCFGSSSYSMIFSPCSSVTIVAAFIAGVCVQLPDLRRSGAPVAHLVVPAVTPLEEPVAAEAPPETQVRCVCDCRPLPDGPVQAAEPAPCTVGVALLASVEVRLGLVALWIALVAFTCGWCCRRGAGRERRPATALARLEGYR